MGWHNFWNKIIGFYPFLILLYKQQEFHTVTSVRPRTSDSTHTEESGAGIRLACPHCIIRIIRERVQIIQQIFRPVVRILPLSHHPVRLVRGEHHHRAVPDRRPTILPLGADAELFPGAAVLVAAAADPVLAGTCSSRAGASFVMVGAAKPPAGLVLEGHDVARIDAAASRLVHPEDLSTAPEC